MASTTAPHCRQVPMGTFRKQVFQVWNEAANGPMAVGPADQFGQILRWGMKTILHVKRSAVSFLKRDNQNKKPLLPKISASQLLSFLPTIITWHKILKKKYTTNILKVWHLAQWLRCHLGCSHPILEFLVRIPDPLPNCAILLVHTLGARSSGVPATYVGDPDRIPSSQAVEE